MILLLTSDCSSTTTFLYDGQSIIAQYSSSRVTKRYVHGPEVDNPLVEYTGTDTSSKVWLISDSRSSITGHVNSSGTSVATNTYDVYGQPHHTNTGRFQYTGQIWLEEIYHPFRVTTEQFV